MAGTLRTVSHSVSHYSSPPMDMLLRNRSRRHLPLLAERQEKVYSMNFEERSVAQGLIKVQVLKLKTAVEHCDELHPLKPSFMSKFGTFQSLTSLSFFLR